MVGLQSAEYWIERLGLSEHTEGGFYRETYRSDEYIPGNFLPERFDGPRAFSTSIYFLLRGSQVSRFHRIKSDEVWYFHAGNAMTIHIIDEVGRHSSIRLGDNEFQAVVRRGCWFGAAVDYSSSYSLVGCTVAPGFDFSDFEMARKEDLLAEYPDHRSIIERLTI